MIKKNKLPYGFNAKHKALSKIVENFAPKTVEEKIICAYLLGTQNPIWTLVFAEQYKSQIHHIRYMKLENLLYKM